MSISESRFAGLASDGFCVVPRLLDRTAVEGILGLLPRLEGTAGTRNLLHLEWCRALATHGQVAELAHSILGAGACPVRAILFDKTPQTNWTLGWHQDTKIAVVGDTSEPGYIGWSVKEGVKHCQPPQSVLQASVAIRLHLDPCGPENGPLRVIPGSHLHGLRSALSPGEESGECAVTAGIGDVLVMRPLLWHASSKSEVPSHRRVLHLEYSSATLPEGLQWAFAREDG